MRKGYTLVEVLIATSLLIVVFATVIGLYIYFSRSSTADNKDQEYYRLYASLEARVKSDLRSAFEIKEEVPGVYTLKRYKQSVEDSIATETVVYWVNEDGLGVDRFENDSGKKTRYDFSKVLEPSQNFQFSIKP